MERKVLARKIQFASNRQTKINSSHCSHLSVRASSLARNVLAGRSRNISGCGSLGQLNSEVTVKRANGTTSPSLKRTVESEGWLSLNNGKERDEQSDDLHD
jgi:hypothetical protein